MTVVAIVHATPAAMAPARVAFAERFPQAQLWNLLDDRLIAEAEAAGGLTPALRHRMRTLIGHAVDGGADAVLLSCSMYGPVAVEAAAGYPVPVLASDQALFETVSEHVTGGMTRVAVLGPIRAGVDDTVARLRERLPSADAVVTGTVVDSVHAAAGDLPRLEHLVADAARRVETTADVIVLGQFSISPAQPAVQAAVDVPVLSPTHLAADVLRARLATAGVGW
jgi:Asp/Glu/hydantoin racemase